MKIILLVESSIHEASYPAGSELEVPDFEGEFLIGKHRAKKIKKKLNRTKNVQAGTKDKTKDTKDTKKY